MTRQKSKFTTAFSRHWVILLAACLITFGAPSSSLAQTAILNVANFGATGDAVQFWVNTTSNSAVVTTTNQLSTADIGKTIEVFGAGPQTIGLNSSNLLATNNQDWVGVITNVVAGTNIYVTMTDFIGQPFVPQATLTNTFATYGTDNTPAFSKAIAACSTYTRAIINVPNGTYLCIPVYHTTNGYSYASIMIHRGGLQFVGQSQVNTVLLSKGAWIIKNTQDGTSGDGNAYRGFLVEIIAPIASNYPLSFQNMTLDGGVQQGNQYVHGIAVNAVDGNGWDQHHSAYLTCDEGSKTGTATYQAFTNVTFQHWRGEMLKSIDQNTNGNIAIYNSSFLDGDATALNIYPSLDCRSCVFSNLFQVAEIYQTYYTNTAYFISNYTTNITGNGWAWNGGLPTSPSFIMQSNLFYFNGFGNNGIETTPGINISILNNQIHCAAYETVFAIGTQGSQGSYANSNIVISGNSVYADAWNPTSPTLGVLTALASFGGPGNTAVNGLTITSNTVTAGTVQHILNQGAYATGVTFQHNTIIDTCASFSMNAGQPMVLIDSSDNYTPYQLSGSPGSTNLISYGSGPFYQTQFVGTGANFILQDGNAAQIPAGAFMVFNNSINSQGSYYNVYLSQALSSYAKVTNGQILSVYWNSTGWTTNADWAVSGLPAPPTDLQVISQ
ncbi:MAG: hypothetical protein ACLQVY_10320 [Limisphaerales bacterium]